MLLPMPRAHLYDAVLFDLDGVLTSTTTLHIACWREALDGVLAEWSARTGAPQPPFDLERDYVALLDGKPRYDGVRAFLRARASRPPRAVRTAPRTSGPSTASATASRRSSSGRSPATASTPSPARSHGSGNSAAPECSPPS